MGDAVGDDVEAPDLAQRIQVLHHVGRLVLGLQQRQGHLDVVGRRPQPQRVQQRVQEAIGI